MRSLQKTLGECPFCGDEIYLFVTKANNRLAKCINEECPKKLIYPLPKAGQIQIAGVPCPKTKYPVIIIIPKIKLKQGDFKRDKKRIYFWASGPCFSCNNQSKCEVILELKQEFTEDEE